MKTKTIAWFNCYLLLITVLLCGCSNLTVQKAAEREETQKIINQVKNSRLIILNVYHNRCESCQLIEPVIEKLQADYSQDTKIAFLKYDLSNLFTILKSRKLAKELGLENIYKSQKYSGIVLFIDTQSKQVLDTLIGEYNVSRYNEIIKKRLNAT